MFENGHDCLIPNVHGRRRAIISLSCASSMSLKARDDPFIRFSFDAAVAEQSYATLNKIVQDALNRRPFADDLNELRAMPYPFGGKGSFLLNGLAELETAAFGDKQPTARAVKHRTVDLLAGAGLSLKLVQGSRRGIMPLKVFLTSLLFLSRAHNYQEPDSEDLFVLARDLRLVSEYAPWFVFSGKKEHQRRDTWKKHIKEARRNARLFEPSQRSQYPREAAWLAFAVSSFITDKSPLRPTLETSAEELRAAFDSAPLPTRQELSNYVFRTQLSRPSPPWPHAFEMAWSWTPKNSRKPCRRRPRIASR
ncbi:MAG: hypothetical protein QM778_00725 [Myxococcales bacterium]